MLVFLPANRKTTGKNTRVTSAAQSFNLAEFMFLHEDIVYEIIRISTPRRNISMVSQRYLSNSRS